MTSKPLVSIIIPCYQAEKTLQQTLDDIYRQTYQPLEVIAVNDGSTDGTPTLLEKAQGRICWINQKNSGASAARNQGFKHAHGAYVLFCDADVRLKPTMIASMVETLEQHPEASYCYSNFKFGFHTFDLFPFDPDRLRRENYISTMSLIRRQDFIGFDESLSRLQDWDLWKRMLDRGAIGVWVNQRLFSSPMRRSGISGNALVSLAKTVWRKLTS